MKKWRQRNIWFFFCRFCVEHNFRQWAGVAIVAPHWFQTDQWISLGHACIHGGVAWQLCLDYCGVMFESFGEWGNAQEGRGGRRASRLHPSSATGLAKRFVTYMWLNNCISAYYSIQKLLLKHIHIMTSICWVQHHKVLNQESIHILLVFPVNMWTVCSLDVFVAEQIKSKLICIALISLTNILLRAVLSRIQR